SKRRDRVPVPSRTQYFWTGQGGHVPVPICDKVMPNVVVRETAVCFQIVWILWKIVIRSLADLDGAGVDVARKRVIQAERQAPAQSLLERNLERVVVRLPGGLLVTNTSEVWILNRRSR